jgi:hypothetical protein
MNLFDILSSDERVIVYSDVGNQVIFTWNRSLTLQAWSKALPNKAFDTWRTSEDQWEEIEVQTLSVEPKTYEKAREAAIKWSQA